MSEIPPQNRRAIYVDEDTFEKINRYATDFKSPAHFIKFLVKFYERLEE